MTNSPSDFASSTSASQHPASSAGALVRRARQAQGIAVADLAASIKIPPRKLEALEADRYHELPDNTYTRALAQAVCRSLKIDATPVLALLPPPAGHRLEEGLQGLNTPFHDRPRRSIRADLSTLKRPAVWAPTLLALAALTVYLLPETRVDPKPTPNRAASAALGASATVSVAASGPQALPVSPPKSTTSNGVERPVVAELLQLRATAASWVEVRDASGTLLLQRLLQPGEAVGLNGSLPMEVKIGNAAFTQLMFRGQAIDLAPLAHDNVARLDLK